MEAQSGDKYVCQTLTADKFDEVFKEAFGK